VSAFTIISAGEVPDPVADAPGARRFFTRALDSEQMALTYIVVAPGEQHGPPGMPGVGHHHRTQEEIYFVVSGTLSFKLDDDVFAVGPKTAVRIGRQTTRAVRNETGEDAELLICSTKSEDLGSEVELRPEFWPR
jgi:mannose-6-phosphate isomerase-like protein (cupin superfamily)